MRAAFVFMWKTVDKPVGIGDKGQLGLKENFRKFLIKLYKQRVFFKVMDTHRYSPKDIGNFGEKIVVHYLDKRGFEIVGINVRVKVGELDIVAAKDSILHIVEVKAVKCLDFPQQFSARGYNPGENLHEHKIRKVIKSASWYIAERGWEGEWQLDGALVWIRERDGMARVQYYPQIL